MDFNFDIDDDFDFGIDDTDKDVFIKLTNRKVKLNEVMYKNAKQLVDDIKIKKGEAIYCNVTGKFIFGDFIGALIIQNNLEVEELTIISLSGGEENFILFDELIKKGWVKKINLVLSSYFARTELKKHTKTLDILREMVEEHKGAFSTYWTNVHSKIVLIRTKKGGHCVIHGSANLRSSDSLEQFVIEENKQLYDFNYNYYKSIIPKK